MACLQNSKLCPDLFWFSDMFWIPTVRLQPLHLLPHGFLTLVRLGRLASLPWCFPHLSYWDWWMIVCQGPPVLQAVVWSRSSWEFCCAWPLECRRSHHHCEFKPLKISNHLQFFSRWETMGWWLWVGRDPIRKSSFTIRTSSQNTGFTRCVWFVSLYKWITGTIFT